MAKLLTQTQLQALLDRFADARIAVVGDFFLDRYLIIDPAFAEPSIETGLTAHQVVEIRNSPGAAGTIVNNLVALGARHIHAVGLIGSDGYGFELQRALQRQGVDISRLLVAEDRFTPTYTKPVTIVDGQVREMERLDIINRQPTPVSWETAIEEQVRNVAGEVDAVIILDQVVAADCGVVTARLREVLGETADAHPSVHFFADSRAHIGQFTRMMLKPNKAEALRGVGMEPSQDRDQVFAAGRTLCERAGKPVFMTDGERGILLFHDGQVEEIPGFPVQGPIDVTGAGDSATAGIVLSLCSGASLAQAALVGNLVASITVQQIGTTGTASPEQVLQRL